MPVFYNVQRTWLQFGFPSKMKTIKQLVICSCHRNLKNEYYVCPRCNSLVCQLPIKCRICNLKLISSPILARTFHHFFPVFLFQQLNMKSNNLPQLYDFKCYGCLQEIDLRSQMGSKCSLCGNMFCLECNICIHKKIQCCPACL